MPFAHASQIEDIIKSTVGLLQQVIFVVFGLAVVVFAWGIVKLIAAAGSPEKIKQARAVIWYGIIGIFVLASLWGIITFFQKDIGVESGVPITVPQFPRQ